MTSMNFHQLPMRHFASRKGTKEVELPPEEEAPKVKRGRGRPRKETTAEAKKDEGASGTQETGKLITETEISLLSPD